MLNEKNIILGVCGSIAAYKSAVLVRLLVKAGANVRVILTEGGEHFITPLTLATLSKNPVHSTYFDAETGVWANHVELGLWADLLLIAPATANTLAKLANGLCDSLLAAVYLSARCPVYVAPAMDLDMWAHPATRANMATLQRHGVTLIPPGNGELASGLSGEGRMAEPETMLDFIQQKLTGPLPLAGKFALVTAGPTYEAIDPVRFIGNHSSGKMGLALAVELHKLGASVTLVAGPGTPASPEGLNRVNIRSASDMLQACLEYYPAADITIMSAAVADYRPAQPAGQKIKKNSPTLTIDLEKTPDVLATLGAQKRPGQTLVGFALETEHEESYALAKLDKKNLDLIVLNSLNDQGAGFGTNTNKITIFNRNGEKTAFDLKPKTAVASDICAAVLRQMGL
ncbi:bifunctional phosphopantothenoylcysteine decarboxylase/phosphopantothenate--cysteine ligase CoaBC [Pedobacter yulinensis]|uniref:Coenzyme A biosynthesis bifunctional protein CoaBC n=1 Tax=Pedobacter yulinensis TaxID=2126353 RepID=A0A2T3HHT5_9SPHI|nr:bifunctional phosphopantothenoylcysteine decarboxylase/phosphopantothenate--cysteine ligase CoaBC [Pedobacter yulinensis]PST82008.1 bifunctional phosphopantothenoylcysteine decarboxylase/phosphopantothenate--cysteine ligase CoaBC [Pedobacter yulinensis]